MVDHQIMGSGAVFEGVYLGDDPIANGDDGITAAGGQVNAKMQALPGRISSCALKVSAGRITVSLDEKPAIGTRRLKEGETEGRGVRL